MRIFTLSFYFIIVAISKTFASIPTPEQLYGCSKPVDAAVFESGLLYSEKTNSGAGKELLQLLAAESGCDIHIIFKPRARIWHEIETGDTAMTINGLVNEERKKIAGFAPYMSGKNLVILKKELGPIHNFSELSKRKNIYIGAVRAYKHGQDIDDFLDQMRKEGRVKEYSDDTALTKAFAAGAFSVMFQQGLTYEKILADFDMQSKVNVIDIDKHPMTGAVVFSNKVFTAAQIKSWQHLVARLRQSGKVKQVFKRFFAEDICRKFIL